MDRPSHVLPLASLDDPGGAERVLIRPVGRPEFQLPIVPHPQANVAFDEPPVSLLDSRLDQVFVNRSRLTQKENETLCVRSSEDEDADA